MSTSRATDGPVLKTIAFTIIHSPSTMSVTSLSPQSFSQVHRQRLVILLVVAIATLRTSQLPPAATARDVLTFKAWREGRRQRLSERRRRERETPLYVRVAVNANL